MMSRSERPPRRSERPLPNKYSVDDTRWPVVVITQIAEQLTDGERLASMAEADRVLDARPTEAFSLVLDNRKAGPVPATQRKLIADYMARTVERDRARCRSAAFVVNSAVMQGVLTAIMWIRKPTAPTEVFRDLGEAINWCAASHDPYRGQK